MMQPSEPNEEDFPQFDSTAKLIGFLYREKGAKVLRDVLALANKDKDHAREYLQEAADELMAMRLRKAAVIAAEAALQLPSLLDLRFCTWADPPKTPAMIEHWRWYRRRQIERMRTRSRELLLKAGVDPDWQDHISK